MENNQIGGIITVRVLGVVAALSILRAVYSAPTTDSDVPASATAPVTTAGVFKSDRGDFDFTARYWPDNGAKYDATCKAIVAVWVGVAHSTTLDEEDSYFSAESQPFLHDKTLGLQQKPPGEYESKSQTHIQGLLVRALVATKDKDGSDLYFANVVRSEIDYSVLSQPDADPTVDLPDIMCISGVEAYRARDGKALKYDYPARSNPIFEALRFGEWERFGLPKLRVGLWVATTAPADLTPYSPLVPYSSDTTRPARTGATSKPEGRN